MRDRAALIRQLRQEIADAVSITSVDALADRISPLSVGLRQQIPVLRGGARLFRIRKLADKPSLLSEVGAPPPGVAPIGRLNEAGQSVLYLADTPATAFAEARAPSGHYCLSEWRINDGLNVALANGGIHPSTLKSLFPNDFGVAGEGFGGKEDEETLALFRHIFIQSASDTPNPYYWSIACGRANGFNHVCGRTAKESAGSYTKLTGAHPLSGIAYPSTRVDRAAINFAFNDLGMTFLTVNHVQWVHKHDGDMFTSLDFASTWLSDGTIQWTGRPAHQQLLPGQSAKLTKLAIDTWSFELLDGDIPRFV